MTTDRADGGDDVAKASLNRIRATIGGSSIDPPLSMLVLSENLLRRPQREVL